MPRVESIASTDRQRVGDRTGRLFLPAPSGLSVSGWDGMAWVPACACGRHGGWQMLRIPKGGGENDAGAGWMAGSHKRAWRAPAVMHASSPQLRDRVPKHLCRQLAKLQLHPVGGVWQGTRVEGVAGGAAPMFLVVLCAIVAAVWARYWVELESSLVQGSILACLAWGKEHS